MRILLGLLLLAGVGASSAAQTRVPRAHVRNGEIVLNISAAATRKLTIDNEWVSFNARFGGVSHEISVPMGAVSGIFAKETGYRPPESRFIDGVTYDGTKPNAYLEQFKIGLKGDEKI